MEPSRISGCILLVTQERVLQARFAYDFEFAAGYVHGAPRVPRIFTESPEATSVEVTTKTFAALVVLFGLCRILGPAAADAPRAMAR